MSSWMLSKVDIDALVTIAMRWSDTAPLPVSAFGLVPARITAANATAVGRELWLENWQRNCWRPEEERDDDEVRVSEMVHSYVFEELPGQPLDGTALRIIQCFCYQTANDEWEEQGTYGQEFYEAIREAAEERVGPDLEVAFNKAPGASETPWGLTENDRDLFTRIHA